MILRKIAITATPLIEHLAENSIKHITRQSTSRAKSARRTPQSGADYFGRYV